MTTTERGLSVGPLVETGRQLPALLDILSVAFNVPRDTAESLPDRVGHENFRVIEDSDQVLGGLAFVPMGQFFGGRSIPMTGIVLVGVGPLARGRGVAKTLMNEAMRDLYRQGIPLSGLYPATLTLYRKAGFEQSGSRWEIQLPLREIGSFGSHDLNVRPLTADDTAMVESMYREVARHEPGNLDRGEYIWRRIRHGRDIPSLGAVVERDGRPEGYLYYVQKEAEPWGYSLEVRDLVALNADAGRRLLTFLADHRSMARTVFWYGSPANALINLFREETYAVDLNIHWMTRIVHVVNALTMRGYPSGLTAEVHLDVTDDVIPENQGRWVLRVADGVATVEPGGNGDARIDIRGLAALYTGFHSPWTLIRTGQLAADESSASALAGLFTGPAPWMGEIY